MLIMLHQTDVFNASRMAWRNRQEAKKSFTRISSLGIPDKSEKKKKETLTSCVSRKARLGKQLHAWKGGMSRDELITAPSAKCFSAVHFSVQ